MNWAFDLEDKIYTIIKVKTEKKLKKNYPDIFYTKTDNPKDVITHFPTVYIHMLPGSEIGMTTEQGSIHGVRCSIQIEVTSKESQSTTQDILSHVADVLKSMGFNVTAFPEANNSKMYYRSIMRASRRIGDAETF